MSSLKKRVALTAGGIVLAIAACKLAVHLYACRHYGYFVDELYYLACSRHLAWGYMDQPPLIALVAWVVRAVLGQSLPAIRLAPALAGVAEVVSHPPRVLGKPDLVFQTDRIAVFVDGCFWHGCPRCWHIPKTNRDYWKAKIARNLGREAMISRTLRVSGFASCVCANVP